MQNLTKYFSLFLIYVFPQIQLFAQIQDDSTKNVYSAQTTTYILEKDVLENKEKAYNPDTTLQTFYQKSDILYENRHFYQDLSGLATATRPIFYQMPTDIGTRLGMTVYDPYLFKPENIKYYNSKSPYTNLLYVQGTRRDQIVHFDFTRNVNERWNVGFYYKRMRGDKHFVASGGSRENYGDHIGFLFHSNYISENKKYQLLYSYAHLNNQVNEIGGVLRSEEDTQNDIFSLEEEEELFGGSTRTWQTQNHQHLFHQYRIADEFKIFQVFDYKRIRDNYTDVGIQNHLEFFPQAQAAGIFNFNQEETREGTIYRNVESKIGIAGKLEKFNYEAYFKTRLFDYRTSWQDSILSVFDANGLLENTFRIKRHDIAGENFVGGTLFYQFSDSTKLQVRAEYLLANDYLLEANLQSKILTAGFKSVLRAPTLIQNSFISNHFNWQNDFKSTLSNQTFGRLTWQSNWFRFSPNASYTLVSDYIYFDENAQATQSPDLLQLLSVGLDLDISFGKFRFSSQSIYTESLGADVFRVPQLFQNLNLYCEDCFLSKLVHTHLGLAFHYKSSYAADAYMPVSKQFHLQNDFWVVGYGILDLYLSAKVKNFRIFGKMYHLNYSQNESYVTTPNYVGKRRAFIFGINWLFFN